MIRATIASFDSEAAALAPSVDREQIAKVIRQGGRRVWVDAVDPDPVEREWIGQVFKLSGTLLEVDYPLFRGEPRLLTAFVVSDQDRENGLERSLLLYASDSYLLTIRPSQLHIIDEVFRRVAQSGADWRDGTASLIYNVTAPLVAQLLSDHDRELHELDDIGEPLFSGAPHAESTQQLIPFQQQVIFELTGRLNEHRRIVEQLAGHTLIAHDREIVESLLRLGAQLRLAEEKGAFYLRRASDLLVLGQSLHMATVGRRLEGMRWLMALLLPPLTALVLYSLAQTIISNQRLDSAVFPVIALIIYGISWLVVVRTR